MKKPISPSKFRAYAYAAIWMLGVSWVGVLLFLFGAIALAEEALPSFCGGALVLTGIVGILLGCAMYEKAWDKMFP